MRLLVWTLGVICTLHALAVAYAIAPRWVWVFWAWLALWLVAGLVVVVAAAVRLLARGSGRPTGLASAPQRPPAPGAPGGE